MKKLFILGLSICLTPSLSAQHWQQPSGMESPGLLKENAVLRDSLRHVSQQLKLIEAELKMYRTSPVKLYAQAEDAVKRGKIIELSEIHEILVQYHPEARETKEVEKMIQDIADEKEAVLQADKHKRLMALNHLKKHYDATSGVTWYENPYFTHYHNSDRLSIYFGRRRGSLTLRLMMSYRGKDWIFFDHAYLSYSGYKHEIPFDIYTDKKTNSNREIWEWMDVQVDKPTYTFLKKMCRSESAKMILSGRSTKERTLTSLEMKAIKEVLTAYDVLKEEMER